MAFSHSWYLQGMTAKPSRPVPDPARRGTGPVSSGKQGYPVADVDDQVEADFSLLIDEFDVSTGHFQRERAGDRAVSGLHRREQSVPDDEGGHLDIKDHGQLEPEGVHPNAVDQQLDSGVAGQGDPVRTELDDFAAAGSLPGLPGGLDQPLT